MQAGIVVQNGYNLSGHCTCKYVAEKETFSVESLKTETNVFKSGLDLFSTFI